VDDEEGPRASLKIVFKNEFDVQLAANGKEALDLARKTTPAVAILDILMPGMSGVDLLRELKAQDEDLEVIMLTAYETLETARQALRFGAREYLNKPFDIPALRVAVAKALERRRATHELKGAHARLRQLQQEITAGTPRNDAASNVVHDLNNPLTVISGFVELLNRQVQSAGLLQGEELEKMKSNIARVSGQVARCVDISRRYLGSHRAEHEERAAVNEVLLDLHELLQKHPNAEGNTLILRELDEPAHAAINSTDLLRVLLNLSTNALQATDQAHRVEVIAQALPPDFDPSSFRDAPDERFVGRETLATNGPLIAISVRDTGPGIPPEIVSRLFGEQFTTKPAGKGTGLGLGSVKALITHARGAVRLSTKAGQGTTFTVFLPVK
jgi:two-component system, sensor histidine kinase and response regulator